ncbi:hypothetical protein GMSM_11410 [Geomonas sp. Red276]
MLDKLSSIDDKLNNLGDELYQSWSHDQRRAEIGKLVDGYRNGLPVQILCILSTSIAGSSELANEHISAFLSRKERKAIVRNESGGNRELESLLKATLL